MSMRRALLLSTGDRYVGLLLNFASIVAVSRLLTPQEIGLMAVGVAIANLVEMIRDQSATSFVIQEQSTTQETPRTAFTLAVLLTLAIALPMVLFAGPLAHIYGDARLAPLLRVLALAILPGPVVAIPFAIMRREMAFALPALINVASTATVAVGTIAFAFGGAGYMSAAYGLLAGNWVAAAVLLAARRDLFWVFRPTLSRLHSSLAFGGYSALAGSLIAVHEFLPNVYLGRLLGLEALGYFNRAFVAYALPDRLLSFGFVPVALPAFSALVRDGHDVKLAFLRGLSYMSAVKWPIHILLAIVAEPVVEVLMGHQWAGIVPLVQAMSLAALLNIPSILAWPVLAATGAPHLYSRALLHSVPVSAAILAVAAHYGLSAMAWGYFPSLLTLNAPCLYYMKRVIGFTWAEAFNAITKSAVMTAVSAAAPFAAYTMLDHISVGQAVAIGMLAGASWLIALRATRHPLLGEINRAINFGLKSGTLRRLVRWLPAPIRAALLQSIGRQKH